MKYGPKIYLSEQIKTKGHWAVGTLWYVEGSKDNVYAVEMHDNGFSCTCPAFKKCKHIKQIEDRICDEDIDKALYHMEMAEINAGRF